MSEPIRNAARDLIDHQVGLMTGSRLVIGELKHNMVAPTPRVPSEFAIDRVERERRLLIASSICFSISAAGTRASEPASSFRLVFDRLYVLDEPPVAFFELWLACGALGGRSHNAC
jgi:hypothetical protein